MNLVNKKNYTSYLYFTVVVSLLVAAIFFRFIGITNGLWHDEVFTISQYVEKGFLEIVASSDYRPNNHVLYNISVWVFVGIFGFSEWVVKLPSIIPSVIAIWVFFDFCRKWLGRQTAFLFLLFAAFYVYNIEITSGARGYGFVFLFSVLLIKYAHEYTINSSLKNLIIFTSIVFLGVYTFPSFIAISALTYFILLFLCRKQITQLFISGILVCISIFLVYLPVLPNIIKYYFEFGGGFQSHSSPSWWGIFTIPGQKLINITGIEYIDLPKSTVVLPWLVFIVSIYGAYLLWKSNKKILFITIFPPTLFLILAVILSVPIASSERYTSFIDYNYLLLFCVGIANVLTVFYKITRDFNRRIYLKIAGFTGFTFIIILIILSVLGNIGQIYKTQSIPKENFKASFKYVKEMGWQNENLVAYSVRGLNFEFYGSKELNKPVSIVTSEEELERYFEEHSGQRIVLFDHVYRKEPVVSNKLLHAYIPPQHSRGHIAVYLLENSDIITGQLIPGVVDRSEPETWQIQLPASKDEFLGVSNRVYGKKFGSLHQPLVFQINDKKKYRYFGFNLSEVSKSGAHFVVKKDNKIIYDEAWEASEKAYKFDKLLYFEIGKETETISIEVTDKLGVVVINSYYLFNSIDEISNFRSKEAI